MKKVFIVIPTFNGLKDTIICLESLPKLKTPNSKIETVIVDNASRDGTPEILDKEKIKYRINEVIKNPKNLGFGKAVNLGIRHGLKKGADYILLLNSDVEISKNFLPSLLDSNIDIISPVVCFPLTPAGKDFRYDYGGYVNWWTGRTYHDDRNKPENTRGENISDGGRLSLRSHDSSEVDVRSVDYMSGCSLLIKREVFVKIGFFDERFFMYFEDVDFCIRAKKAGFKVAVDPQSIIVHKLGGSIRRWSTKAIYYNISSNALFIIKHYGLRTPIALVYLTLLTIKIIIDKIIYKLDAKC